MPLITHLVEHLSADQLPEGVPIETEVGGKKVCLLRKKETVLAFTARCPHAGAPLCEGWLNGAGHLVCPLHKYVFNPENGLNLSGEGYKLFRYPVEIKEGRIFITVLSD